MISENDKKYPHFTPGNYPNRSKRRKDAGINKRGLHKPKTGESLLLIFKNLKFRHYRQIVPVKDEKGFVIGTKEIIHTN